MVLYFCIIIEINLNKYRKVLYKNKNKNKHIIMENFFTRETLNVKTLTDFYTVFGLENSDFNMNRYSIKSTKNHENDTWEFTLTVPGFKKKELEIKTINNRLFISGETESDIVENFTREWTLPEDINPETLTATLKNGILSVVAGIKKDKKNIIKIN